MTGFPEHPATGRLALFALCGDLVIAIDALSIVEIRRAAETVARALPRGRWALEVGDQRVPGWDLGELLNLGTCVTAWVIVDLPRISRRMGFRIGRCFMVEPLPVCRTIPRGIFGSPAETVLGRPEAIAAAFSVAGYAELAAHVAGVVVDLACVLPPRELATLATFTKEEAHARLDA